MIVRSVVAGETSVTSLPFDFEAEVREFVKMSAMWLVLLGGSDCPAHSHAFVVSSDHIIPFPGLAYGL